MAIYKRQVRRIERRQMMEVNQNRIYVNLTSEGMLVSRETQASHDLGLVCGSSFEGSRAAISSITIESCQLTAQEFRDWRVAQGLDVATCAARYGLSTEEVECYESLGRFVK